MKKSLGSVLLLSTMMVACGGPLDGLFMRPSEAKCDNAPTNITKDAAVEVPLEQPFMATNCPIANTTLWWKTPAGSYAQGDKFHVVAEFRDGAGNVDLHAGTLNSTGNDVVVGATDGNCTNPAGASEDCTITLSAGADRVYIHTGANDPGKENFKLTITKL